MDYKLFEATLGGVALSSLADEILLTDIVEEPVQMDTQTAPLALGDGMLRTVNRRESLSVRLVYQIRTQDVARRAEVRDLVAAWAVNGGALTVNTRPGKQLRVVCDTAPEQGSSGKWTDDLEIVLTAYAVPYWEDVEKVSISVNTVWNANRGEYYYANVIRPTGNVSAPLEFTMLYTGTETLNRLKIICGSKAIEFTDMGVTRMNIVQITYDVNGLFKAYKGANVSLLPMRTPESEDELFATPGTDNQIYVLSDAEIHGGSITCRGRWL